MSSRLEVVCFREQFDRHDAGFLGKVKGLPCDPQDGIVTGRPRKGPAPPPPVLIGQNTQKHNPVTPDSTEGNHSETAKETDDTNNADDVPMSQTPSSDGQHDRSHIKADTDGVRTTSEILW